MGILCFLKNAVLSGMHKPPYPLGFENISLSYVITNAKK